VLESEFYLGITEVVEVAERSRVVNLRDLQQNIALRHGCRIQIPLSILLTIAGTERLASDPSCFLATDRRCISVDQHRPAATFGLTLLVIDSML
jgi:hypothetical protein